MAENIIFSNQLKELLAVKCDFVEYEFFDKNMVGFSVSVECVSEIKRIYHDALINLCKGEIELFFDNNIKLAQLYIELEVPYIALMNEINRLNLILIEMLIDYDKKDEIINIHKLNLAVQNIIAKEYLVYYIQRVISVSNSRLSSLNDMLDQHTVVHYGAHLKWLIVLAKALEENNNLEQFPQTDKTVCDFGQWLATDAKSVVKNNSKLKELDKVHSQLHYISSQIKQMLSSNEGLDYDVLLTYLEKCELLSLSIGTELALIDNSIVNLKATKDTLTGALGRQTLEHIFHNQYEITLATNGRFVIAVCDIDHFKKINDTYGHIAGDQMLKSFVELIRTGLRNSDIIIRYGGEEFIVILPAIDKQKALKVLENIKDKFENFVLEFEGNSINTTVSIGTYEIEPIESYNKDMLDYYINLADKKLYDAKNSGRNMIK